MGNGQRHIHGSRSYIPLAVDGSENPHSISHNGIVALVMRSDALNVDVASEDWLVECAVACIKKDRAILQLASYTLESAVDLTWHIGKSMKVDLRLP